jgi:hypothetical protein
MNFFDFFCNTLSKNKNYFFLIGGQSNVGTNTNSVANQSPTGRVPYSNLPTALRATQTNTKVWDGTDFDTSYVHPLDDEYGWLNHFFYELNQLGYSVAFYKYGEGGRQLKAGSSPSLSYTRATLKSNAKAAWDYFDANNDNTECVFLWCQGYTDGLDETNSLDYGAHDIAHPDHATGGVLGAWFSEVRTHFSLPNMKIIYNTLSNNATGSTYRANIKLGQEYVDTLSANNYVIDADDLQFLDTAHFGATGVIDLANLYKNELIN